jgi:hypothetical protein
MFLVQELDFIGCNRTSTWGWFRRPDLWGQAGRLPFKVSCLKVFLLKIRSASLWAG